MRGFYIKEKESIVAQSKTFGPYSPIRKAGDLYFVSGQVGVDPDTNIAGRTIEEQTAQVLVNMASVLETEGLDMDCVIKTTIYLTDMNEFAAMNKVYEGYFNAPRPARGTVAVRDLPHVGGEASIKVEIEAVAARKKS